MDYSFGFKGGICLRLSLRNVYHRGLLFLFTLFFFLKKANLLILNFLTFNVSFPFADLVFVSFFLL